MGKFRKRGKRNKPPIRAPMTRVYFKDPVHTVGSNEWHAQKRIKMAQSHINEQKRIEESTNNKFLRTTRFGRKMYTTARRGF